MIKFEWTRSCMLSMKKVTDLLRRKPLLVGDALKNLEITTNDLEYYIHLADEVVVGF
jgi:hypothetical protein